MLIREKILEACSRTGSVTGAEVQAAAVAVLQEESGRDVFTFGNVEAASIKQQMEKVSEETPVKWDDEETSIERPSRAVDYSDILDQKSAGDSLESAGRYAEAITEYIEGITLSEEFLAVLNADTDIQNREMLVKIVRDTMKKLIEKTEECQKMMPGGGSGPAE